MASQESADAAAEEGLFFVVLVPATNEALRINVSACITEWRQRTQGLLEDVLTAGGYSYEARGFQEVLHTTHCVCVCGGGLRWPL